jgi:thiosulfate/3-mercaptopyruvate sulfurtransferase
MHTTLITAPQLQQLVASGAPLRVMDCSFELMKPDAGQALFEAEHIPGSVYVHLDHHLSDKTGADRASGGRHPLPSRETFAARLGALGLHNGMQAVVLDRQAIATSGRLWWMLKWCGHEAVAVLDGGLAAWKAAGGAVETGPGAPPAPATFALKPPLVGTATRDEIAGTLGRPGLTLVDARAAARFRGETEPLDPVAGHVPGAVNRPVTDLVDADGRLLRGAALREALGGLADAAAGRVTASCGSGVTAAVLVLALHEVGVDARLFPGSWSQWVRDPRRPVATGPA